MKKWTFWGMLIYLSSGYFMAQAQQVAYYVPNPVQIPALAGKGDGNIMAGISLAGENAGYNLMSMYSPRKSVVLTMNHNGRQTKNNWIGTNFSLTEIGAGAYYAEKGKCASAMIGYGHENVVSTYNNNFSQISNLWMQRFLLQAGWSYTGNKGMIGVGLRFILLDFYKGRIQNDIGQPYLSAIKLIEAKSPIFYHELAFQASIVRYDPVYVTLHVTTFFPKQDRFRLLQGSVGLCLGYHFRKQKEKKGGTSSM